MGYITVNPAAFTDNDQTAKYDLGTRAEYDGETYRYIQYSDGTGTVTAAASALAYYLTISTFLVTSDISDTKANNAAGVTLTALTDQYYGWIKTKGYVSALKTNGDDDITAGDALVGVGDGTVNSVAAGTAPTYKVVGWAVANDVDAADTVEARIDIE